MSLIFQAIVLISYIPKHTDSDLEFTYLYTWDLTGNGGDYYQYNEKMTVKGHYRVDFNSETQIASVNGEATWNWDARYMGAPYDSDEGTDIYQFQYNLTSGEYIGMTTDQEEYKPDMKVWFHIVNVEQTSNKILDKTYEKGDIQPFWVRTLTPLKGISYTKSGTFTRDDLYGDMEAEYSSEYFFTPEGYLLGEIYTESDIGYSNYLYSSFDVSSKVFVTSANYLRPMRWGVYLSVYILPLVIYYLAFIALYGYNKIKSRKIELQGKSYILQQDLPQQLPIQFASLYRSLIPSYLWRAYAYEGRVVSLHDNASIYGLGFVEKGKENIGTFFGMYQKELVQYANVEYAFSEVPEIPSFFKIETFDVLRIANLPQMDFEYHGFMIKPLNETYLPSVAGLITNEDYGEINPDIMKWVERAMHNEIVYVAVVKTSDPWVQEVMTAVQEKKFPPPDIVGDELVLGVGFAVFAEQEKVGWLYGLYVHPAFRNLGVGKTLAIARLVALKELGVTDVITEIADWNGPAKKIYEKFNAQTVGKIFLHGKTRPKVRVRRR